MIMVFVILGIVWIFAATVTISTLMLSSQFNRRFEDMEENWETGELSQDLQPSSLDSHKQITRPSKQVLAGLQ